MNWLELARIFPGRMNNRNSVKPSRGLMDALDDSFPKFLHTSFIKKYGALNGTVAIKVIVNQIGELLITLQLN